MRREAYAEMLVDYPILGNVGVQCKERAYVQVRDEILNIMHRNNIGEKRGTWMEVRHVTICYVT